MRSVLAMLLSALLTGTAFAAMSRGPTPVGAASKSEADAFDLAEAAARAGECRKAIGLLVDVLRDSPEKAEAWNLLAYCQRKTGDLDEAFENYAKALDLEPEFPEAREYLGEAHLQAALRELEILRGYGEPARAELDRLVAALRRAADEAEGPTASAPIKRDGW